MIIKLTKKQEIGTYIFWAGWEFKVSIVGFGTVPSKGGNETTPVKNSPQLKFEDGTILTIPLDHFDIIEGKDELEKAFEEAISKDAVDDAVISANNEETLGSLQDLER